MAKKSFKEKISDDFTAPVLEEVSTGRSRTKAVPGARLIPIDQISPDSEQPRKIYDKEKLKELSQSIKSQGLIEPITVRESDNGYKIITGERRYRASKLAGLDELPCIIKKVKESDILSIQLIENIQRENLNPVEEAYAFKKLIDTGVKQTEAAKQVGKSQPYISQSLKILALPEEALQKALKNGTPKEQLLQIAKDQKPKPKTAGRPKTKPWTWKPNDKSFSISIKFKKQNTDDGKIIEALEQLLEELRDGHE